MQIFSSLLALLALGGAVIAVLARVLAARLPAAATLWSIVSTSGLWLAFLVATGATLGSLYFSEVADYIPCKLCWYQRIAMYPLVPITLVAALRRDRTVLWYTVPIASIGAGIAAYHYLIEWRPSLEGGACGATGPGCADIWFREFGFVTLAFMALAGFLAIIIFTFAEAMDPEPSSHRSEPS